MMIPTLLAMRDFSRMREIITVLTKYGLGGFVQRIRLGAAKTLDDLLTRLASGEVTVAQASARTQIGRAHV